MCKQEEVLFTTRVVQLGRTGIDFVDDEYDWLVVDMPGAASVGGVCPANQPKDTGTFWMLDRLAATYNQEDVAEPLPSSDVDDSFRSYFIPHSEELDAIKARQNDPTRTVADYVNLLRMPRIPLSGWYLGDTGYREVLDTNFGKGHRVPVDNGMLTWALVLTSRLPATETQAWNVTLDFSKHRQNPLRWSR